jgi:hypothetical protein
VLSEWKFSWPLGVVIWGGGWKACQEVTSETSALMGEKNIKFYLKEIWCGSALDSSGSGQEPVVVSCGLGRPRDKVQFLAEKKTKKIWWGKQKIHIQT